GQLDPHRQTLDNLHVIARGVLRRQQSQGLASPHGEARDSTFELAPATVHVDLAVYPLADAQVRELSLLEVGVDPDLRDRSDGHQALSYGDVVARIDVAARHHAVDLADDIAVAEVQFGLGEVSTGLLPPGHGLTDRWRLRYDPLQDPIDVPL